MAAKTETCQQRQANVIALASSHLSRLTSDHSLIPVETDVRFGPTETITYLPFLLSLLLELAP